MRSFHRTMLILTASLTLLGTGVAQAAVQEAVPAPAPARGLPDNQLAPLSLRFQTMGEAFLAQRQIEPAIDHFESALAADPRNRQAILGLARAAEAQGLPGKAVRFYREALDLDPTDQAAIELQGLALVQRGAVARAESNLERLRKLCASPCPAAERLASAIERGPTPTQPAAAPTNSSSQ